MASFTCDVCDKNIVDTGDSNPSFVVCAECNGGNAAWNCTLTGSHACHCKACGPAPDGPPDYYGIYENAL